MKRLMICLVLSSAGLSGGSAWSADRPTVSVPQPQGPAKPVVEVELTTRRTPVRDFFGRVWELEQRKNAWLRRTFLGR